MTAQPSVELHRHRDPHGSRVYASLTNGRVVLVLTTESAPGVTRIEFTSAEWNALNASITAAPTA